MFDSIKWRYELRLRPYLLLHENLLCALSRKINNFSRLRDSSPLIYISADASNIGDRVSALGVQMLAGAEGVELFSSRVALPSTFKTLNWLQNNRSDARVIIGGGGLLQECFDPFWRELVKTNLRFALFGVGANELTGRNLLPDETMHAIADKALMLHVRDKWSYDILSYANKEKLSIGVCPSVNYLRAKYSGRLTSKQYLLHVQHPVDIKMAGGDPDRISNSVRTIAADLGLVYDETSHIKENLSSLVARYQRAQYVVSSRLHGCIFSYAFGVPFLPIATDKKISAFVDTHLPGYPLGTINSDTLELRDKLLSAPLSLHIDYDDAMGRNVTTMCRMLENFNL